MSSDPVKPGVSRPGDAGRSAGGSDASDGGNAEAAAPKAGKAAKMAEGLHERREHHKQRSKPYRAVIVLAGFVVVVGGVVLSGPGVPGPGFLVIAIGLAILALEFDWAERLLNRALAYADRVGDQASELSPRAKVAIGVVSVAALAAFVAAAIAYDIPLLPV